VAFAWLLQLAVPHQGQHSNSSMQAIIKLSITEYGLTVTNVLNPAFNKDDKVRELQLLIHGDLLLNI
jgi:hypothetical protein